ncbi:MAG: Pr6Pr family membrane protein [Proteobacteria bacterium]|nr:Pr6Pr family membrane protein [Pseudomonadota bacterium]
MNAARLIAMIGATTGVAALLLQFGLMYGSMTAESVAPAAVVWRYLGYFTILTNIFVAVIWIRALLRPDRSMPRLEAAGGVSIVMVGIIYHALLASRWNPQGLQLVADFTHHTLVPAMFLLYWLLRPHGQLKWTDALLLVVWPLAYCPYALMRGAVDGWYAYFFLDPRHMSVAQLITSITGLSAVFLACALVVIALDKIVAKRASVGVVAAT